MSVCRFCALVSGLLLVSASVFTSAHAFECDGVRAVVGESVKAQSITRLDRPVDILSLPGDTARLFVVEQRGRVQIVNLDDNSVNEMPFLDINERIQCCREEGLLGMAFHPNYAENGYFYLNYIVPSDCANGNLTRISRFQTSADPDRADVASEVNLLELCQPDWNHNGGQLQFGPLDGYLYIGFGDGGEKQESQNGQNFLGAMLRIDVDREGEDGKPYAIPADNPFVGNDDVLDEIWSQGLRNPWRFSFDPVEGDLYIADVGSASREEINFRAASRGGGENYEWPRREGNLEVRPEFEVGPGVFVEPAFDYPHDGAEISGSCIIGGVLYRGCRMPDLHGRYYFADLSAGRVFSLRIENETAVDVREHTDELDDADQLTQISAFGVDARGEVYFARTNGPLFRIEPASSGEIAFLRGDANTDRTIDIGDAVTILFATIAALELPLDCADAFDADDSGTIDLTDALDVLNYLFLNGVPLAPPFPRCGGDVGEDALDCLVSNCP